MVEKAEGGWNKEVLITKKYHTMGGFIRGCKAVLKRVFDDPYADYLTLVDDDDERTVEERIRGGEFVEYNHGTLTQYKAGFEFEYPDRIYAFCLERKVNE